MNPNWMILRVTDFAEVFNGGTPSTSNPKNFGGDIPWITPKDLSNYEFRFITRGERSITQEGLANSSATIVPAGTILLTSRAPVGYLAIAQKPVTTNQGFKNIVVKEGFDNRFIFYLLKSNVEFLKSQASGSTFAELSGSSLKNLSFTLPPLPEQHAIADVLSALDDKIELNRHMNTTLESLAQALFKHTVLDNPERGNWKEGFLSDICQIPIGGDWGSDTSTGDDLQVICLRGIDLEHLRKEGFSPDAPLRWIKKNSLQKRKMTDCDVLIAGSGVGPVGRPLWVSPSLIKLYGFEIIYSNFCKRLTAKSPSYALFIDRILHNLHQSKEILDYVNGTSLPNLDINGLINQYPLIIPPQGLVEKYYEIIKPFYAFLHSRESQIIAELRDTLLPKLISGKVRMKLEGK